MSDPTVLEKLRNIPGCGKRQEMRGSRWRHTNAIANAQTCNACADLLVDALSPPPRRETPEEPSGEKGAPVTDIQRPEVVEAAAKAMYERSPLRGSGWAGVQPETRAVYVKDARTALAEVARLIAGAPNRRTT